MFDLDKWQEIFSTMRQNLLRTVLTAFSVSWGIFMLIILLGAGNGFENGVRKNFDNDAKTAISFQLGQTSMAYDGLQPGKYLEMTNEDKEKIEYHFKDKIVYSSGEFNLWRNTNVGYLDKNENFDLLSVHPDHLKIEFKELYEGRYVNPYDLKEKRKVAVVGHLVQEKLFDTINPIGKYIDVNGIPFKIIGIFKQQLHQNSRGKIIVPISTAQSLFAGKEKLDQILVTTKSNDLEDSKIFINNVTKLLSARHHFDPKDKRALFVNNNIETGEIFTTLFMGINGFVWFIAFMTLLAGVIGVGNIMLIVVKERTKEIGVRKAIGATPMSIISLIFQEAIVITTFSGYVGLIIGLLIIEALSKVMPEFPMFDSPTIDLGVAVGATILLIILGAFAGLAPAIKAARIRPIEALRVE